MWSIIKRVVSEWRTERMERKLQRYTRKRVKLIEKQQKLSKKYDERRVRAKKDPNDGSGVSVSPAGIESQEHVSVV